MKVVENDLLECKEMKIGWCRDNLYNQDILRVSKEINVCWLGGRVVGRTT